MNSNPSATASALSVLGRYWGWLVLAAWGGALLGLGLVRTAPLGLDEGAARGLLLIWSVFDRIINPIVTMGVPDFRALLFAPLGAYWTGSVFAAKVYTILLTFGGVALLHAWARRTGNTEAALLASALLLVSPPLIGQVDAMGSGVFLLLAFGLGAWLDQAYRRAKRPFGGWFFVQILCAGFAVTLHPAGLAYPLVLAWSWYSNPLDARLRRHVLIGLGVITLLILAVRQGWRAIDWFTSPVLALAQSLQPIAGGGEASLLLGWLLLTVAVVVVVADRRFLSADLLGRILLFSVLLGAVAADGAWALLLFILVMYRGVVLLIALNQAFGGHGLARQRGLVLGLLFVLATVFMVTDKSRIQGLREGVLNKQDVLIKLLADDVADLPEDAPFQAASQWPGRTMIAVKRTVFPLPRGAENGEALLRSISGITHLIFDHQNPANRDLARNIAELSGVAETTVLEEGGVIIHIRPVTGGRGPVHEPERSSRPRDDVPKL
ncbi:MAG TPA: hypothetical protein ENJ19_06665 [Gammaproteobacteria bacterium]|nr:hypothetical protein [Gammaproteobacteria bacterium]